LAFFITRLCEARAAGAVDSDKTTDDDLKLLTDVHAGIEAAAAHGGEYSLKTSRQLQFDILRTRDFLSISEFRKTAS